MSHQVDRQRWAEFTIFEQMGNISSEVGRSFAAKRRDNQVDLEKAVERALDLFDATTSILIAQRSPRTKEVLRSKEEFLNALYGSDTSEANMESLDRYFTQFAIAARLTR